MDLPICRKAVDAIEFHSGQKPVLLPTLGGSLPIYLFEDILKIPIIGLPIVNHDNNQHQPDENLRLGQFWAGIDTMAALFLMKNGEEH